MNPIIGASLVSGGLGIFGQMGANAANKDLQAEANDANARIAAENRQWQEMMANTAHQREVRDLKLAGLNPILSATGGSGAATPSGSTASMGAAKMEDVISKGLSSARDAATVSSMLPNQAADTALKESSVVAQAAQTAQSITSAKKLAEETKGVKIDNMSKTYNLPATKKEASLREVVADIDKTAAPYDAIMNRALDALGGISSAIGQVFKPKPGAMGDLKRENKTMKEYINKKVLRK